MSDDEGGLEQLRPMDTGMTILEYFARLRGWGCRGSRR
jgi:hypothetical protein